MNTESEMSLIFIAYLGLSLAARPWYLDELSNQFVKTAVQMRNANVPEATASSIAKRIIDGGLTPPQVTQFAENLVENDLSPNLAPSQVLQIVDMASQCYKEIRTSSNFDNYLAYISRNIDSFDLKQFANPTAAPGGINRQQAQAEVTRYYRSLDSNPQGHSAIINGKALVTSVAHDAKVRPPSWAVHPNEIPSL